MTWDQLRADLNRALGASFPDEAQQIVARLEKRLHHVPVVEDAEEAPTKVKDGVLLAQVAEAVQTCFPDRGQRIMQKVQRILEPPENRGDPTCYAGVGESLETHPYPVLVVRHAAALPYGTFFEIRATRAMIGRSSGCDFQIREEDFSRRHLEVFSDADGRWFVADQRSLNGTFVNKQRLEPLSETPIVEGDKIRCANVVLSFHEPVAVEAAAKKNGADRLGP